MLLRSLLLPRLLFVLLMGLVVSLPRVPRLLLLLLSVLCLPRAGALLGNPPFG